MAYQIPRGCQDVFGNESYKWQALEQTLRSFCYMYNYDEIRTPIFEHTEVFKRENDSSDMVNKELQVLFVVLLKIKCSQILIYPQNSIIWDLCQDMNVLKKGECVFLTSLV